MKQRTIRSLIVVMGLFLSLPAIAPSAWAQTAPQPSDTCTTGQQFSTAPPPGSNGLITTIATQVQNVLSQATEDLFNTIQEHGQFRYAGQAALTLYIAIYGILFTFGMTQITVSDFAMRMIKFAIIAIMISDGAWIFFNTYVVQFFNNATNELINVVTSISIGGINMGPANCNDPTGWCSQPLAVLDQAVAKAISANMAVHLLATMFTSPYGFVHTLLLGFALWSFLGSILTAIWVYMMSMVLRALLFGIAPIFIVCLLFQKTRHLFDGWLNQVVNACLQPILLFTFFSFFVILIQISIDNILKTPVCWTEARESMRGTPFNFHFWRYSIWNQSNDSYEPYGGSWGWTGTDAPNTPIFPIDIMAVLVFLILAELGKRFNQVVLMIARDLAGAATDLSGMQSSLGQIFSGVGEGESRAAAAGGGRSLIERITSRTGGGGGASGAGGTSADTNVAGARNQASAGAASRTTLP